MELLIPALILSGCAAVVGGLRLARAWRGRGGRPAEPAVALAAAGRGVEDPRPQDVVILDGQDYLVSGVARLADGRQAWCECLLQDGLRSRWLLVPAGDPGWLTAGQPAQAAALAERPTELLEVGGEIYRLHRRGVAEVQQAEGDLGGRYQGHRVEYWDYRRPGAGRLWVRREAGAAALTVAGQRLRRHLLGFLPGS